MNTFYLILAFSVPVVVIGYIVYDLWHNKYVRKSLIVDMPYDKKIDDIIRDPEFNEGVRISQEEILENSMNVLNIFK